LSAPPAEAVDILNHALQLAERLNRKLDVAGCKLFLAHLCPASENRIKLWEEAAAILEQIGAAGWIENKSAGDAILLPLTV
jgi:hypothetical protein